jgi:hypothetical protein
MPSRKITVSRAIVLSLFSPIDDVHPMHMPLETFVFFIEHYYRNRVFYRVSKTLGKCQRIFGKYFIDKRFFAEYFRIECRKALGKLRIGKTQKTAKHFLKL